MQVTGIRTLTESHRRSAVGAARTLNAALDYLFYDVNSLTSEERGMLSPRTSPEGSVLIVPPGGDSRGIETLSPLEFLSSQRKEPANPIDCIVVAGVGSSALGTAALARNAADYLTRPVAGIVSGYGLADMLTEALGGWFVLGFKNSIRDAFAKWIDILDLKDHVWDDRSYRSLVKDDRLAGFDMDRFVFGSPDAGTLLLTLYHLRSQLRILVGHSKGNYVIENALEGLINLCAFTKEDVPKGIQIVTLGAVVRFPVEFSHVSQFIGGIDSFGMINSRPGLDQTWVAGTWHSLNRNWPGHMSVHEMLQLAGVPTVGREA